MAVFIDTGIFVATRNADDKNHKRAAELMSDALQGRFGAVYTSDYILDEAVTVALIRTRRRDLAVDMGRFILESPRIEKIMTSMDQLYAALKKFQKFTDKTFSFTDCVSLTIIERNGIDYIMSFDSGFDGIVSRIS
nr:PIN domain-containing protein [Candidatus Freyarchaeota archaeon]